MLSGSFSLNATLENDVKGGETLGRKYLYTADIAGCGPDLLGKMFAAQNMFSDAQWVFGGGYFDAKENNITTVNMISSYISQWRAVALWGPKEVALKRFINGESDQWLRGSGQNLVRELLGGRMIEDIGVIRSMMQHQEIILWLLDHLQVVYDGPDAIFARNGVYLNHDYINTPLDFAISAKGQYWWSPGSRNFAYNKTGKLVVTSLDHPSEVYGTYFNQADKVIHGPVSDQSFGIQYPREPARLILQRTTKFDANSQQNLPVIYIIDSDEGLVGAL